MLDTPGGRRVGCVYAPSRMTVFFTAGAFPRNVEPGRPFGT